MESLVSVVIPVYNSGAYLEETIQSVQNQTYKNVEIILSNSGSTDSKTLALLKKLSAQFTLIEAGNHGVSVARNKAIEVAKGEYILALDSDDIIKPSFIASCVKALDKDVEVKVVRSHIELFGKKKGRMTFAPYRFSLLLARNLMVVTSMFRKNDWERVGGFDANFTIGFEDWEFWINLLKDGGKVFTIDDYLFKYRIRRGSKNHSLKREQLFKVREQLWNKHKELYAKHYFSPSESFEYKLIEDSLAFRIGSILLKPFESFKLIK